MAAGCNDEEYSGFIPIVHLEIVRDSDVQYAYAQVKDSSAVADLFKQIIGKRNTENLVVMAVDSQKKPVMIQIIGTGAIDYCQFSTSEIWKAALLSNSTGIIVSHNHPSGSVLPSNEDLRATKRFISVGDMLGVPLIDHVIVSDYDHYSFRENNSELWKGEEG